MKYWYTLLLSSIKSSMLIPPDPGEKFNFTSPYFHAVSSGVFTENEPQNFCISFFNIPESSGSLTLKATQPSFSLTLIDAEINTDSKYCQSLELSPNVDDEENFNFLITFNTTSVKLSSSRNIKVQKNPTKYFISTDKPIYLPGELVKYTIIAVDKDFVPVSKELSEISIKNPSNSKLKSTEKVRLDEFGKYSSTYQLLNQPALGDWSINIKSGQSTIQTTFNVNKVTFPKSSIDVQYPESLWWGSNSGAMIEICGKYTHGASYQGTAEISYSAVYWSYDNRRSEQIRISSKKYELPISNNCIDHMLVLEEQHKQIFEGKTYPPIYAIDVSVVLTDIAGEKLSSSGRVQMLSKQYKIESVGHTNQFHKNKEKTFKFILKTWDNVPVSAKPLSIEINPTGSYWWPYWRETEESKMPKPESEIRNVVTNADGEFDISYTSKNDAFNIQVTMDDESIDTIYFNKFWYDDGLSLKNEDVERNGCTDITGKLFVTSSSKSTVRVTAIQSSRYVVFEEIEIAVIQSNDFEQTDSSTFIYEIDLSGKINLNDADTSLKFLAYSKEQGVKAIEQTLAQTKSCKEKILVNLPATSGPGETLTLTARTSDRASCLLAAVDESVMIYSEQNNLKENSLKSTSVFDEFKSNDWIWGQEFVEHTSYPDYFYGPYRYDYEMPMMMEDSAIESMGVAATSLNKITSNTNNAPEPTIKVRNFLPTVFIYENFVTDGEISKQVTTPDTMTTWQIDMMCSTSTGQEFSPTTMIQVSKDFYMDLKTPYSATRNELIKIPVMIFNRLPTTQSVSVSITADQNINVLTQEKTINVASSSSLVVYFQVEIVAIGEGTLTATAIAGQNTDSVQKKIKLKAEGFEKIYTASEMVCLDTDSPSKTISLPSGPAPEDNANVIDGSEFYKFMMIDDLMGGALENLDKLLRVPTGCGEQNMVGLVPNIAVANYLNDDSEAYKTAVKNAQIGYERELNYQRADGSFSAFGDRDKEGSIWLTAFVVRSFAEAKQIEISNEVMTRAVDWMLSKQNPDGCFPVIGKVIDSSLLDRDSVNNAVEDFVTINVILALLKYDRVKYESSITDGFGCIARTAVADHNTYILAQLAYLNFINDGSVPSSIEDLLDSRKIQDGEYIYWSKNGQKQEPPQDSGYWWYYKPSTDVEITSYVLMSMKETFDEFQKFGILKFIQSQRNDRGGWSSTQNTMMALSALADYANSNEIVQGDITINANNENFNILSSEPSITRVSEYQQKPDFSSISAAGQGCVLLTSSTTYNVREESVNTLSQLDGVSISIELLRRKRSTTSRNTICAKASSDSDDMAMVEIIPGTAQVVKNLDEIENLSEVARIETNNDDKTAVIYLDDLGTTRFCFEVEFESEDDIAVSKREPAKISAYKYYDAVASRSSIVVPLADDDTAVVDGNGGITIRDPDGQSSGSNQSGSSSNEGSLSNGTSAGKRVMGSITLAILSRGFFLAYGVAVF